MIFKYTLDQVRQLETCDEIPESFRLNEGISGTLFNGAGSATAADNIVFLELDISNI